MLFICPTARNMIVFLLLIRVESRQLGMAGFWLDSVSLLTMQESESFVNASERGDREWSGGKLSYQSTSGQAMHVHRERRVWVLVWKWAWEALPKGRWFAKLFSSSQGFSVYELTRKLSLPSLEKWISVISSPVNTVHSIACFHTLAYNSAIIQPCLGLEENCKDEQGWYRKNGPSGYGKSLDLPLWRGCGVGCLFVFLCLPSSLKTDWGSYLWCGQFCFTITWRCLSWGDSACLGPQLHTSAELWPGAVIEICVGRLFEKHWFIFSALVCDCVSWLSVLCTIFYWKI